MQQNTPDEHERYVTLYNLDTYRGFLLRNIMNAQEPIIAVDPLSSARDRVKNATRSATDSAFRAPSYEFKSAKVAKDAATKVAEAASQATTPTQAHVIDGSDTAAQKTNLVAGAVQTVAGGALMLVGIPMLILPGPGIAAIAGGAAIAAGGIKKLRRK